MGRHMEEFHEIVIVGAGASGLLCGCFLGKAGKDAVILEKNASAGRKLLATGNGRCNFTNRHMSEQCFYGDKEFVTKVLAQMDAEQVIGMFEELGMFHRERDGYCYPYSGQAAAPVMVLTETCRENGVSFRFDTEVRNVVHKNGEFVIHCNRGENFRCRTLVLAAGGKAGKELGGSGSGYKLCRSLSHHVTDLYPGLTGLRTEGRQWTALAGVRLQGQVTLLIDGRPAGQESGEIQLVRDGISGIPVFQLCRIAAEGLAAGRAVTCYLDCCPAMSSGQLKDWLSRHGAARLSGVVHAKLARFFMEQAGQSPDALVHMLKQYEIVIKDTFGFERAQVTAGGVSTDEVEADSMQSKLCEGLFIIGELLDVDGICGGYNLHFAWSTAFRCAKQIIEMGITEMGKDREDAAVSSVQDQC